MSSNGDCSLRQDWCEEVDDEESLSSNNQEKVGHKHDCFHGNGTHVGQVKDQLEEELTRLVLVTTENKCLLKKMLTHIQETDDELRLVLELIRNDLEKGSTESVTSEEVKKRNEEKITENLTALVEGQEEIKSEIKHQSKIAELTKLLENMTLKQHCQEREKAVKPPLKCYWCHEEGHLKRNCPRRFNRQRWIQKPAFNQTLAFRHKQNFDEMHKKLSMTCSDEESNNIDVIGTE